MSEKDGGPAFPIGSGDMRDHQGISIRDYFSAKALEAIVSMHRINPCGDFVAGDGLLQHHRAAEYAAATAYQFADAMLKERAK